MARIPTDELERLKREVPAKRLAETRGVKLALASRSVDKLSEIAAETGAITIPCDAGQAESVETAFATVDSELGGVDLVLFNASMASRGPLLEQDPAQVEQALRITCFGGFLVALGEVTQAEGAVDGCDEGGQRVEEVVVDGELEHGGFAPDVLLLGKLRLYRLEERLLLV